MAAAITVTPAAPQAGISMLTVTGSGFAASTTLSLEITSPEYGSNWVLPDGTVETQARKERFVTTDPTGAFAYQVMPGALPGQAFTVKARPVAEQALDTTPITTATFSLAQPAT